MNDQLPSPGSAPRRPPADSMLPPPVRPRRDPRRDDSLRDDSHRDEAPPARRPTDPNFAARRMLVVTILITAIVAGGVSIWRLFGDDEGGAGSASAPTTWNRIALVDRANGDIGAVTPTGELDSSTTAGTAVTQVVADTKNVALISTGQVAFTNLSDEPTVFPLDAGSTVSVLPATDRVVLAAGQDAGGNLTIMRSGDTEAIDLGALTGQPSPRFYVDTIRSDADGTRFAVADAKNFQTVVVTDATTEPMYLAGVPLALNSSIVATSQIVGTTADITLSGNDRARLTTVTTDLPIGGAIIDGALLMVTRAGDVVRITPDATEAEKLAAVAIPSDATDVSVALSGDGKALVVLSDRFEAVIGADGTSRFSTTFTEPLTPIVPQPGWDCLPVGGADQPHSLINLADGTQVADLAGTTIEAVSADGCTVLATSTDATEVVSADGKVDVGRAKYVALAPDGNGVVRQLESNTVEYVPFNDDQTLGEPVDLTSLAPVQLFAVFVDQ